MVSTRILYGLSTVIALVNAQARIEKAVGDKGQSRSLFVDQANLKDFNLISTPEIAANIVNECGRTSTQGNIDIGEQTEVELAAGRLTTAKKGGKLTLTINQQNAQGSGPFTCDLDLTSNTNGATGQTKLTVNQNAKDFGNGKMTMTVDLPKDMACIGASTGDVCTMRCFNKNSFGGCVSFQQTDTTAAKNTPENIKANSPLKAILDQVSQDQADFASSVAAIAGSKLDAQGKTVAEQLVKDNKAALDAAAKKAGQGNNNNNNAGNGNAGAGNGNAGNGNNNAGNGNGGNNNNNNNNKGGNRGGNAANGGNGANRGGNAANGGNGANRGGNNNANGGNGANGGNAANRGGNNNANRNGANNNNNKKQKKNARAVAFTA